MGKFVFRLDNILAIKEKIEEQEKINFGNAQAVLNQAVYEYELLLDRKDGAEEEFRTMLSKGSDALKLKEAGDALEVIKLFCKEQLLVVENEERNVELARKKLEFAMIERKTYEKLKENEFEKYKQEMQKKEGVETDELVSYKYSPNTVSEVR